MSSNFSFLISIFIKYDKMIMVINMRSSRKKKKSIIKTLTIFIIVFIFLVAGIFLYSRYLATTGLEIREYKIQNDLFTKNFHGFKILHMSDIHYLTTVSEDDLKNIVKKCDDSGNHNVCLTERGASFGYNTLVTDMRSFPQMANDTGCPVIMDATHAVQQPGGLGGSTGGQREFAPVLARAAVAVGVAAVFMETHDNPDKALSDGPNTIALKDMKRVISELMAYDKITKEMVKPY